jgi:two-component sensor histidine kinase
MQRPYFENEHSRIPYYLLVAEADHRLLNNLQTVSSLLSLQLRRYPELAPKLHSTFQRVQLLQSIHMLLRSVSTLKTIEFKPFLEDLCSKYAEAFVEEKPEGFSIDVAGDQVELTSAEATALATAINELLTNAIKYGEGAIRVTLRTSEGSCAIAVQNEGAPLPEGFSPSDSKGLGMAIVTALAARLRGKLEIGHGDVGYGPKIGIEFPLKRNPRQGGSYANLFGKPSRD